MATGDNVALPVRLGQIAAGLGIPLLQGAVFGEKWLALVRGYGLGDPDAPCPSCHLSALERATATHRAGCDPQHHAGPGPRTVTLPHVCRTAAQMVIGEILKWLLETETDPLRDQEVSYCLLTHRVWRTRYSKNPTCRHQRWRLADLPDGPESTTLSTLAELVPETADGAGLLQVRGEIPFASFTLCDECQRRVPVRRFARPGAALGRCRCGAPLTTLPQGLRSVIPQDDLGQCRELPLAELGVQPGEAIGLSYTEPWNCFFLGESEGGGRSGAALRSPETALACE